MKKYVIVGLVVIVIVCSLIIGGVTSNRAKLKIDKKSIPSEIYPGDIFSIRLDTNLDKKNIAFSSSDPEVLFVNNEGLVTILKDGEVTVLVHTVYEEKKPLSDSVTIKIKSNKK